MTISGLLIVASLVGVLWAWDNAQVESAGMILIVAWLVGVLGGVYLGEARKRTTK